MLGDDYISQHISQGYRDYLEQTSYKSYIADMARNVVSAFGGNEIPRWIDIVTQLDRSTAPAKQTETEQQIKSRIMTKLNGKEG